MYYLIFIIISLNRIISFLFRILLVTNVFFFKELVTNVYKVYNVLDDDLNPIAKISTHLLSRKLCFAGSMRSRWGI